MRRFYETYVDLALAFSRPKVEPAQTPVARPRKVYSPRYNGKVAEVRCISWEYLRPGGEQAHE